jgi:RND family efflux transporter MFP subunit
MNDPSPRSIQRLLCRCVLLLPSLLALGCDRDPGVGDSVAEDAAPVLVAAIERGPFAIDRRYAGTVRAAGDVKVVVRESGSVISVPAPGDSHPVKTGDVLLVLRSPDLEVELRQAEAERAYRAAELDRYLRLAKEGLTSQATVDAWATQLDQARLQLERLQLRRDQLRITAPASGTLLAPELPAPGQWCTSGQQVARIIDPNSVVVDAIVPASLPTAAGPVENAVLELPSGHRVDADVASISAQVDPTTGGRTVTLRPRLLAELAPGSMVTVHMRSAARAEALLAPAESVLVDPERGSYVLSGPAPGERGYLRRIAVVPGPSDGRRTVIEQGIGAGVWVAVNSDPERIQYYRNYLGVRR